ncbi:protein FAM228B isoform X2 [Lingula anatina]|uniref:Protein FAM228B isoform X2 n=1 Tax=Lingula anatina TaxID=7574 RepID=A0A1S3KI55_LINAN|nr:protein FAM228B isoform X2 [Lingula anatina]|eukprot:XP_013421901.1 protein FAM228B isoform X2 [Lingula anatina]
MLICNLGCRLNRIVEQRIVLQLIIPQKMFNSTFNMETILEQKAEERSQKQKKSKKTKRYDTFVKYLERADIEARDTKKMYNSVLDVEDNFVKDIDAFLAAKEVHDLRKKEILHKKWNDQVHEPIRKEVIKEMGGPAYKQLDRRKRQIYKEYLEFTNQKGHVFLDTVDPAEYCPLGLHVNRPLGTRGIHAETKPLRDPLLSQAKERAEEDRTILRCTTGITYTDKDIEKIKLPPLPLVPLGRHGTECKTWLAMPMHDIESPVRKASRGRMRGDYNHSQFNFAQWAKMPFHPAIVDEELQSQRKRLYTVHPPYTLEQTDILVESPARLTLPPNKLACSV